jgi:hypothetical protein
MKAAEFETAAKQQASQPVIARALESSSEVGLQELPTQVWMHVQVPPPAAAFVPLPAPARTPASAPLPPPPPPQQPLPPPAAARDEPARERLCLYYLTPALAALNADTDPATASSIRELFAGDPFDAGDGTRAAVADPSSVLSAVVDACIEEDNKFFVEDICDGTVRGLLAQDAYRTLLNSPGWVTSRGSIAHYVTCELKVAIVVPAHPTATQPVQEETEFTGGDQGCPRLVFDVLAGRADHGMSVYCLRDASPVHPPAIKAAASADDEAPAAEEEEFIPDGGAELPAQTAPPAKKKNFPQNYWADAGKRLSVRSPAPCHGSLRPTSAPLVHAPVRFDLRPQLFLLGLLIKNLSLVVCPKTTFARSVGEGMKLDHLPETP